MCAFRQKRDTSLEEEGEDFDVNVDKVVYKDAPPDVSFFLLRSIGSFRLKLRLSVNTFYL